MASWLFVTLTNWSVTIGVERLEKATARAAFVAWAEMTTALRRDGTEWHRATYRLQNRSLQFLPVKMPVGAQLVSVRVAGQNVRADAGKVSGQSAVLVPLIKTKPGDLSYNVELVYRKQGRAMSWRFKRELDDPELLGITVEKTFWNVWLPDDRKLQSSTGNMEPVLAEVNKAEKLGGQIQELKSLVSIAGSEAASLMSRGNAVANIDRLKKEIESENRDDNFGDNYGVQRKGGKAPKPTPAEETVGKKGLEQQGEYVANKRREVNEELGKEVRKLAEITKNNSNITAQTFVAGGTQGTASQLTNNGTIQFGNAQSQTLIVQGQTTNAQGQTWNANGGYLQQAPPAATPVPTNGVKGNNFYFNDNVVLNNRVENAPAPAKPASKGKDADYFAKKLPAVQLDLNGQQSRLDQAKAKTDRGVEDMKEKKQSISALNTARGNNIRFQEEQTAKQQLPVAQPRATPMPNQPVPPPAPFTLAGGNSYTGGITINGGTLAISSAVTGTGGITANAIDRLSDAPSGDEAQRLQPTGRVSLAVDFPTEGQLFHFKKVKANAQLGLTVLAPESLTRWKYLALAAVLAGALAWVSRRRRTIREV